MNLIIVGPGTIGASLALACALHGHRVSLLGRRVAAGTEAQQAMHAGFATLRAAGLLPPAHPDWDARISYVTDIAALPPAAEVVLEAIDEDLQRKCALFRELERSLPDDAIFASSTSGLAVDAIAAECAVRERIAVAHFANPPHLMPTVELVPGSATSEHTMTRLASLVQSLGKIPIRLRRDLPGHVFNRIQFAMLREAMALVAERVASPAEIDLIVKRGLALRLAEEGPLEKMDLAGIDLVHRVASYLFPELDRSTAPAMLDALLAAGRGGARAGGGFHDWDEARRQRVLQRRDAEVIRHLRRLRAQEEIEGQECPTQ